MREGESYGFMQRIVESSERTREKCEEETEEGGESYDFIDCTE